VPAHTRLQTKRQRAVVRRPCPRARQVRPGTSRRVVAHQRGEQDVNAPPVWRAVHREQWGSRSGGPPPTPYTTVHPGARPRSRTPRSPTPPVTSHSARRRTPGFLAGSAGRARFGACSAHLGTRISDRRHGRRGVVTLTFLLVRLRAGTRCSACSAEPPHPPSSRPSVAPRPRSAPGRAITPSGSAGSPAGLGPEHPTGRPVRALLGDAVPATLALVGTSLT